MNEDTIAIFPLPNVVFFPHTRLPLHIFEPRYCEMVKQALANHQSIGMFVLEPGWEQDYYGNPEIYPVGCAGEIVQVEALENGKYNIVLQGLYRARAIEEVQHTPFRMARVEVLPEGLAGEKETLQQAGNNLLANFRKLCKESGSLDTGLIEGAGDPIEIVNNIAMHLPLDLQVKLELLLEDSLRSRASLLEKIISKQLAMFRWVKQYRRLRPSDPSVN